MYNVFSCIRTYNANIAQKLGLSTAVFLQAIIEIENSKGGPFRLDSAKIYLDYGIDIDEQQTCIDTLINNQVIEKVKGGNINVLPSGLSALFKDSQATVTAQAQPQKMSKSDAVALGLLKHINTTDETKRKAYADWIESAMKKNGYLTGAMVDLFQSKVESYTNPMLTDPALAVLRVGMVKGWKDATYCISYVNQNMDEFSDLYKGQMSVPTTANNVNEDSKSTLAGKKVF